MKLCVSMLIQPIRNIVCSSIDLKNLSFPQASAANRTEKTQSPAFRYIEMKGFFVKHPCDHLSLQVLACWSLLNFPMLRMNLPILNKNNSKININYYNEKYGCKIGAIEVKGER